MNKDSLRPFPQRKAAKTRCILTLDAARSRRSLENVKCARQNRGPLTPSKTRGAKKNSS
jgi:hypothetical protein